MTIHVVGQGDSLWRISQWYGIPMDTIAQVNGLESDLLIPGLALYLPTGELPERTHTINVGETLWYLSNQYNTSLQAIIAANPEIDANRLHIGQRIIVPSPQRLSLSSLGFVVPYPNTNYLEALDAVADQLTFLAVASYSLTEEGYIYVKLEDDAIIRHGLQQNVLPLLMIRNLVNGDFSPELMDGVLGNPQYRNNLVRSLVHYVKQKGYVGVSIDFEFIPPRRRNEFIEFLYELKNALEGYLLHVNVHAKTEDIPMNPIIGAYDYTAIGRIADLVAVMTMDYGYPGGPPNPVAPFTWVEKVVRYCIGLISTEKIQIALPLYGYDWVRGTTSSVGKSILDAQQNALETKAIIQLDTEAMAPYYYYWIGAEGRIVWFEDIRSYVEKYRLVDLYQLAGVSFWQIGLSFPQNWVYMRENFLIKKEF